MRKILFVCHGNICRILRLMSGKVGIYAYGARTVVTSCEIPWEYTGRLY